MTQLSSQDLERMHDLTVKNHAGVLAADVRAELNAYRQIALELDILRAKSEHSVEPPAINC